MCKIFDLENGITAGVVRLGISQGEYTGDIEVADSGVGFKYSVARNGVRLCAGEAADFSTAKKKAEEELRLLCHVLQ